MADTICIDPDALVYGTMGSYGIHQKQSDFILSAKMSVIRACYNGYITPDSAASQIISLQNSKPMTPENGNKMAEYMSQAFAEIGKSQSELWGKKQAGE